MPRPPTGNARAGLIRQTVEMLVLLCLCVVLVRTFSAEAYVVPTGSMAPTLLGLHRELTCDNCRFVYVVGIEDEGHTGQAVCPNCGRALARIHRRSSVAATGYWSRSSYTISGGPNGGRSQFSFPRRAHPVLCQARCGLPGDSIRIAGGDIYVAGQIVRKSLPEIRAMRILIHDSGFHPQDSGRFPRWQFRAGTRDGALESGWTQKTRPFHTCRRQSGRAAACRLARLPTSGPVARPVRTECAIFTDITAAISTLTMKSPTWGWKQTCESAIRSSRSRSAYDPAPINFSYGFPSVNRGQSSSRKTMGGNL